MCGTVQSCAKYIRTTAYNKVTHGIIALTKHCIFLEIMLMCKSHLMLTVHIMLESIKAIGGGPGSKYEVLRFCYNLILLLLLIPKWAHLPSNSKRLSFYDVKRNVWSIDLQYGYV